MSGDEPSSYAPKSPDLSSFYSSGPPDQPAPPFDSIPAASLGPGSYGIHNHNHQFYSPAYSHPHSSSYAPPVTPARHPPVKQELPSYASPSQQHQYAPPAVGTHPGDQPYGAQPSSYQPGPYGQQYTSQSPYPGPPAPSLKQEIPHDSALDTHPFHTPGTHNAADMPGRRSAAAALPADPIVDPSPVKTKFPTARIKRIMQADEEVGKVAQQTPIAVGKALELFMVQMVTKSADVAKDKGSRRVTAAMLKQVVEADEQWDFLRDIVSRVENEKEGSKAKAKTESESEEEVVETKKRGRGGRRKKA